MTDEFNERYLTELIKQLNTTEPRIIEINREPVIDEGIYNYDQGPTHREESPEEVRQEARRNLEIFISSNHNTLEHRTRAAQALRFLDIESAERDRKKREERKKSRDKLENFFIKGLIYTGLACIPGCPLGCREIIHYTNHRTANENWKSWYGTNPPRENDRTFENYAEYDRSRTLIEWMMGRHYWQEKPKEEKPKEDKK
jgi:hypothetical protein